MTTLLVGGEQGLVMLQEQPYGWEVWERTDAGWAGRRVWALARTPGALFAGTDAGLVRSTDRGLSWKTLLAGDVRALMPHPGDTDRCFAGLQPAAAWHGDDALATWHELTGLGTPAERADWYLPGATPLDRLPVARVVTFASDPAAPNTVYAGVEIGGIYRSDDGGATWHARNSGLPSLDIHRLVTHPLEPETVFAATETGVYRSVDRGESWAPLPFEAGAGYTRALLALPPDGPGDSLMLLAGPAEVDPWGWAEEPDGARSRLFASDDDGATWRALAPGHGLPPHFEGLISALVADPDDPYTVWLGTWDGRVFATRDRCASWVQIAADLGEIWAICPMTGESPGSE